METRSRHPERVEANRGRASRARWTGFPARFTDPIPGVAVVVVASARSTASEVACAFSQSDSLPLSVAADGSESTKNRVFVARLDVDWSVANGHLVASLTI